MNARSQAGKIAHAIELHKAGRLAEAEAAYLVLLRARPNDGDAMHFLGMLRMHQGRRDAAIELIQRSLEVLPGNPHAWNNLANLLVAARRDDEAEAAYLRATQLAPELSEAWFNLGVLYRRVRRTEEAVRCYRRVIDANPQYCRAYERLGMVLYSMGLREQAADIYRKWHEVEPDNPIAAHMAAAASGEGVPDRAADRYVATLFDAMATQFDESLQNLGYAAPRLLAAAIEQRVRFGEARLDVLDAGCGTGWCGPLLRSSAKTLVGVDLSAGMLAKAHDRKMYDELVEGELCAFMRSRPGAFDLVNCADTLVYFGALEEAAAAAAACLRPDGVFAFTVESEPDDSAHRYRILMHGRYAHRADYVTQSLRAAGFGSVEIEAVVLRQERGDDVKGHLVVARIPISGS